MDTQRRLAAVALEGRFRVAQKLPGTSWRPCCWTFTTPSTCRRIPSQGCQPADPVRRELAAWQAKSAEYLARRPIFSQVGLTPPWEEGRRSAITD